MKKLLVFLSILFVGFTGVLAACSCGEDKYADLRVSVVSIVDEDGH